MSYAQVFIVLALRGLKATIIFVEHRNNENVGKKRAAKMPHPNEIFGISISLLLEVFVVRVQLKLSTPPVAA